MHRMQSDIEQKTAAVFKRVFPEVGGEPLDLDRAQNSFENWDSFAHLELVSALEGTFGISFSLEEVAGITTPRGFVKKIAEKIL